MKQIKNILSNKKVSSIILGAIIIILVAVVIVNLFFINKDLNSKKIKNEDVYVYFGDEKFDYKGNITLDHEGKITNIKFDNKKVTLYSEPIYYAKKEKVILPVPYSVVNTSVGLQNKVMYYTEIVSRDGYYYLVNNELDYKLNNNFLFDGSDMYIFIQSSKVTFGDKEIEISPLSYVNYVFDTKDLYIYNYEKKKIEYYENVDQDVFVSNKNYKVNLSSDNIIINEKQKLLMKNFDYLKKLKG
ncbi:MAG: hypothetical protein IKE63_05925 [Bacilli bacterium]|nr:hypothetical protein [Bacilli bacterium]